jgi:prepilin-type N-terminal cleavage/methylation domain-containing protein/prepilin-type processing-associated H-X9-DG protein
MQVQRRGFTLIEVLVVIAVVMILLAILVPSIVSARRRARTAACLNNLHQLALATFSYGADYGDRLPYPVASRTIAGKTVSYEKEMWFNALDLYLSRTRYGDLSRTNAAGVRAYMTWKECSVWGSISKETTKPAVNNNMTVQEFSRTIKMNSHLRRVGGDFAQIGDVDRPVQHVLYGDGTAADQIEWPTNTTETSQFSMDINEGGIGGIAVRHDGAANIVFVDGHASTETHKTFQRQVGSTAIRVPAWESEFVNAAGAQVRSGIDGSKSMEAQGLKRNSAMPLVWSIPGRLYRP